MHSMTGKFISCVLVMVIHLLAKVPGLNGEVFAVGGAAGWTVPHKGMVNYTEWAAMLSSLNVGDTLLFTYPAGEHNVVQVAEEDFNRCRATSPIQTYTDGQTLVNLPKEGQYWFICGFSGHCLAGQKFVIDVIILPVGRGPAPAPSAGDNSPPFGGNLGPSSAFAPSGSLGGSPFPAVSAPSPLNSSSHALSHSGILSVSLFLAISYVLLANQRILAAF